MLILTTWNWARETQHAFLHWDALPITGSYMQVMEREANSSIHNNLFWSQIHLSAGSVWFDPHDSALGYKNQKAQTVEYKTTLGFWLIETT